MVEAARSYTYFNPADSSGWNLLIQSGRDLASTYVEQGRISEGTKLLRETAALEHDPRNKTGVDGGIFFAWRLIEAVSAQNGDMAAATEALAEIRRVGPLAVAGIAVTTPRPFWSGSSCTGVFENDLDAAKGNYAAVLARTHELDPPLRQITSDNARTIQFRNDALRRNQVWMIEAALAASWQF